MTVGDFKDILSEIDEDYEFTIYIDGNLLLKGHKVDIMITDHDNRQVIVTNVDPSKMEKEKDYPTNIKVGNC